jgi:putative endopeptidase
MPSEHTKTRKKHLARPAHPSSSRRQILKPAFTRFLHAEVRVPPPFDPVHPGTDFYRHVNGHWQKTTPLPKYTSSYGVGEEVEDYIDRSLSKTLVRCYTRAEQGRQPETSEEYAEDTIGRLAMSALRKGKQKHNVEYLKRGLQSLRCLRDPTDIARALGLMCRFRVPTILSMGVTMGMEHGHPIYFLAIGPGDTGLPDVSYYRATAPGKSDILYAYAKLFREAAAKLDVEDYSQVIPLEANIATALEAEEGDPKDFEYSFLRFGELKRKYATIPWEPLLEAFGLRAPYGRLTFRIESDRWIKELARMLAELPLEQWYTLFAAHTLLHAVPYLPAPFDDWHFDLFGRRLQGQQKKTPQLRLTLQTAKSLAAPVLGFLFRRDHLTDDFRRQATQFVRSIVDVAVARVGKTEWLEPVTRRRAAEKLRRMRLAVGYADSYATCPMRLPALQTDTFLANIYLLEAAQTELQIGRLHDAPADPYKVWDEAPYIVNAFYYNEINQIIIPAGNFFWPFYNQGQAQWLGWNYGGLGSMIGHEIVHAFDKEGQMIDERGDSKDWWTRRDEEAFREITTALVRTFNQAKVLGRPVNGAATLNENLADLGGLGIALEALKRELRGVPESERQRHLRDFFVAYAVSWRTKEQPARRLQRLFLDKHAPVEARVNFIVQHFDEWYEAFEIKTDDALYIPPEERLRIF